MDEELNPTEDEIGNPLVVVLSHVVSEGSCSRRGGSSQAVVGSVAMSEWQDCKTAMDHGRSVLHWAVGVCVGALTEFSISPRCLLLILANGT